MISLGSLERDYSLFRGDIACVADRQNRQYSPSAQRLPKACSDIPLFVYPFLIG